MILSKILITVALDLVALGIIAPVLPNLIIKMEGGDIARPRREPAEASLVHHRGQPTARMRGSIGTSLPVQSVSERRAWKASKPSPS